jgi:hypothetical protein
MRSGELAISDGGASLSSRPSRGIARKLTLFIGFLLTCAAVLLPFAAKASALDIGMMWSGDRNQIVSEMNVVKHSGATIFQMPIDKSLTSNGTNWSTYDSMFERAWSNGLTILPGLARGNSEGNRFPTEGEYSEWDEWVEKVVKRYGYGGEFWAGKENPKPVASWGVWNEPNLKANNPLVWHWNAGAKQWESEEKVQPESYGHFLVTTAAAIRNGQKGYSPQVLFAGLYMPGGTYYNTFLQEATSVSGGGSAYDGVLIHPYSFYGKVTEMGEQISSVRYQLDHFVSGGSGKPLIVGELGWPVSNPNAGAEEEEYKHGERGAPAIPSVSEAEQASLLTSSFNWLKSNAASDNIQSIFWYNVRDTPPPSGTPHWDGFCGLRERVSGRFRPAWTAFQEETGATPWTGGNPAQAEDDDFPGPHAIVQENGTIDVFYRTPAGELGHDWVGSGGGLWASGSLPGSVASAPHAIVQANGTIDIFYRTPAGELGHDWYDTGGSGWHSGTLGGSIASDPHPILQPNGTIDVFYRTPSGELGHDWVGSGGGLWASGTLPGSVASDPHAVVQENGTIDVFYRTPSGELGHNWYDTGGSGWHSGTLGGSIASDPQPILQANGTIDVFYRTPAGELGHDWVGSGGGLWASGALAGELDPSSTPHVIVQANGTIDVFFSTPAGELGHDWYDTGGSGWHSGTLGGSVLNPKAPKATSEAATGVKNTEATIHATVNPEGAETTYQFEYGPTAAYGTAAPAPAPALGTGTADLEEAKALTGLSPGATYHYRVVASNEMGTTYGADKTLTTTKAPSVTTEAASAVNAEEATLNSSVNPEGFTTTYQFEYGPTTAYGSKAPASAQSAGSGTSDVAVSQGLTGLTENTTYHYRLVATNSEGTTYGSDGTLKTAGLVVTETSLSVTQVLYGQPGYVSVSGSVKAGATSLTGEKVTISYEEETSAGVWSVISSVQRELDAAGNYGYENLAVGRGHWRAVAKFQGGATLASSSSSYQGFDVGLGYRLMFGHSGKCFDVQNWGTGNGALIQQWDCLDPASHLNQVFQLVPVWGPWYQIRNINSGRCVDVIGASTANGGWLQQWDCAAVGQQMFQLVGMSGGWVALQVAHSGKCIDVNSSSTTSGVILQQWDCQWSYNQWVAFLPVA